ncbi:peptidase S8 [Tessaracoccus antarcticus]|uniref:Peptidase S8 n=2 Tax=Tessaracoccus antarcticus TaxID=2479848 RepID=A0A3M0GK78_9ACTN|nr:peptidase S8 [Tessaracoccus antarcticus]
MVLLTPTTMATADPQDGSLGNASDYVTAPDMTTRFATTGQWFVELKSNPTSVGGSQRTIQVQQDKFISDARAEGLPAQVSRTYTSLFNGFSVDASAQTAATYAELPSVKAVYPVVPVAIPKTQAISPQDYSAIAMTGADVAQSQLGFTGQGVKVGIIDTGIDYDHPDFGGSGTNGTTAFPTARVAYGHDFVGDDYNADPTSPKYDPVAKEDTQPDDCNGHGTHVAGIVGAAPSARATGVAPDVTLGAYRVFGCDGSTDTAIILSALELAEKDGMDVVNMSLGYGFQSWPTYPTSTASDRLVSNGVVVVAAAGNDGDAFTQAVGSPSTGVSVISVASYDNTTVMLDELIVHDGADDVSVGYSPSTGSPKPTSVLNGTPIMGTTDPLGCEAETADMTGKVAITSRGTCSFAAKAVNAQESGAKALIIYNNAAGFISATVEGDTAITIPVVTVTKTNGETIVALLTDDADVPTVEFTGQLTSQPNPTGGLISDFSSWGLAADLTLKPDLGAPGGSIYSTFPLELDGYATLSGTSMASPHVAGAVALMLQANPGLTPAQVLTRLQNTAEPSQFSYAPTLGVLDAAHHQGAGLIQVDKAIVGTTTVSPGKISTGESADGPYTQTLTINNGGAAAATWTLEAEDAVSTYVDPADPEATQNTVEFTIDAATVQFSATTVTVPAGGSATVDVTISPDDQSVPGTQYSGFVHLSSTEGAETVSVPFAGMAGDYGALTIFPDLDNGLPALVRLTKCDVWEGQQCIDPEFDIADVDAGAVFNLGKDLPTVIAHVAYPAARVTVEVLQASASGAPIESSKRTAYAVDNVTRDAGYSLWSWDGRLTEKSGLMKEVAPGNYVLRLTALEADGDGGTQSWTSPAFGVKNTPVPTPSPTVTVTAILPPTPLNDLYSTPGYHTVNGRKWFTTCEKYSQTTRCRTSIYATTIAQVNGKFVVSNGWVFNNLTYLPSARSLWKNNPLGNTGSWTAADGRQWRTECDTAATGRNGCRSFAKTKVIEAVPQGAGYTYRWTTKWVLNNIVRFS